MPASSPALDLGLKTLGEVVQLTPAPSALKAIISTSQNILQIINAEKTGNQDEQRLAQVVLDIAVAYSDGVKKLDENACKDPDIDRISNNLYRCLESISKALMDRPKAGFFARLLTQSATRQRIKGWEQDLDHISSVLAAQIQLRSSKMLQAISSESDKAVTEGISAMEERVKQAHQETLDLIKSEVLKKTRQKLHKSSFGHFPPATSPIFYGRSDQVRWLVESLVQVPAFHAIMGTGGIGKTSLALNMLHDPRIVEVYGKHRYFLACETTLDAGGIIAGLADIFSLDESAFVKQFKSLCGVIKSNILFLLDNFETPWERKEARQNVEELLTELSSIPNLSIVITLRGAERPCGIQWSRPCLPVLGPLDLDAACQTFVTISDTGYDDPNLPTLMEAVEFIPLAITLLAAQASYSSCAFLLEQWQSCKTSMVTRGWDSRLSSLDVSISLSLTSSRFTSNPQALPLLQILSLLPDGATMEELGQMTPDDLDIHKSLAVSTLLQVALASIPSDRVRVLAPVREYVQLKHPISPALLRPILSYHAELSRYARLSEWTLEAKNVDAKLTVCIGNIHHVIRMCLDVELFTDEALRASVDVSCFRHTSQYGAIGQLLEESVNVARDRQKPALLAGCLQKIGLRMWYNSSERTLPLGWLEESVKILRGLPRTSENCDLLVSALNNLSWYMLAMRRHEEAIQVAQEAVDALLASTSPTNRAMAYMRLALGLADVGRFSESRNYLDIARSSFDPSSSPLLGYLIWSSYIRLYARRDMYKPSLRAADMGLSLPAMMDSDRRRGVFLSHRGMLWSLLSRFENSQRDICDAIQCLASGSVAELSKAYCMLGLAYLACGDFQDAELSAQTASQFQQTDVVDAKLTLATLELYQNRLNQSTLYLDLSSKDLAISGFPIASPPCLYRRTIRCQVQIRQRAVDTLSSCISAVIAANKLQDRAELACSLLVLGDAYFFLQKDVSASKSCYQANLDLVRHLGSWRWIANALLRLGVTDYFQGDPALAVRRVNQAMRFYEETEGKLWVDICKSVLRAIEIGASIDDIPVYLPVTTWGF